MDEHRTQSEYWERIGALRETFGVAYMAVAAEARRMVREFVMGRRTAGRENARQVTARATRHQGW